MTDITVSRELLRQVAEWSHLSNGPEQLYHLQKALRAALEQSVVKPDNLQCKSVQEPEIAGYVNPTSLSVMRIGEFDWIKLYPDNTGGHIPLYTEPQAQTQPPILTEVEVERLTVFAGLHDIETPLLAEFIRAIERVVRRQFRQTRTAPQAQQPAPVQEPIGWSITCNGGHTGNFFPYRETAEATLIELNRKYPTDKRTIEPLFAAQPRKAVKLSDSEILTALDVEYVSSAQNRELFLSDARTIEQAVWAKCGYLSAPVQEPSDSDYATIAGLEASIGHLSRLVDEQRKLLVRCADVFGVDRFSIPFEDGDSELIDRVREMVATTTSPTAIQWPKARDVGRYGDMSQEAHMRVGLDSDNDVFVSVWDGAGGATVEFCTPGAGGGKSSETRMALIALMVAMEKDNARTPRLDWWAQRMGAAKG